MEFNSFAALILSGNNQKKGVLKSKIIEIKYDLKEYPLEICLFENSIILNIQEKYSLYYYQTNKTYQDFLNLHKYFRFFDNLSEIYEDLIKNSINIKEINEKELIILFNVNINKNNYDINIILNKKELDKIKDIDIIISNYIQMKKELDELKLKYGVNEKINKNINIFNDSIWLKNNENAINLIKEGIKHQLNKNIQNTSLLYRGTRDGDDRKIFHQKCDGISNTLIIGETTNGNIFGGFTTQNWGTEENTKYDNYAFLFQINQLKNYYAIKGKGGIFCNENYGPTFGNNNQFEFCFQYKGKALETKNTDETGLNNYNKSFNYDNKNYVLEGNRYYCLKDYEVFKLTLN